MAHVLASTFLAPKCLLPACDKWPYEWIVFKCAREPFKFHHKTLRASNDRMFAVVAKRVCVSSAAKIIDGFN